MNRGRRVFLLDFFPTLSGQTSSATNMVDFVTIARYDTSAKTVDSYYWICKTLNSAPTNTVESSLNFSRAWYLFHLMVDLSKCACLYFLMCTACTIVWNQEQIFLQIFLQLRLGGPIHLYHPLHSWYFSHSWDFCHNFFYTVTSLIGCHCINWYQSTHVHSCADWIYGADINIGIFLYLHSSLLLMITLLLVSRLDFTVPCALYMIEYRIVYGTIVLYD